MTADMARALLTKMKSNRQWAKLPRVTMNLSGEAVLVYSDALALVRVMVCAGRTRQTDLSASKARPLCRDARRLLSSPSPPWQSGSVLHSQYWEIRSIRESSRRAGRRRTLLRHVVRRDAQLQLHHAGSAATPGVIENLVRVYENGVAASASTACPTRAAAADDGGRTSGTPPKRRTSYKKNARRRRRKQGDEA